MGAIDRRSRRRVPRSVKRHKSRFPKFLDSLMLGKKENTASAQLESLLAVK